MPQDPPSCSALARTKAGQAPQSVRRKGRLPAPKRQCRQGRAFFFRRPKACIFSDRRTNRREGRTGSWRTAPYRVRLECPPIRFVNRFASRRQRRRQRILQTGRFRFPAAQVPAFRVRTRCRFPVLKGRKQVQRASIFPNPMRRQGPSVFLYKSRTKNRQTRDFPLYRQNRLWKTRGREDPPIRFARFCRRLGLPTFPQDAPRAFPRVV